MSAKVGIKFVDMLENVCIYAGGYVSKSGMASQANEIQWITNFKIHYRPKYVTFRCISYYSSTNVS